MVGPAHKLSRQVMSHDSRIAKMVMVQSALVTKVKEGLKHA